MPPFLSRQANWFDDVSSRICDHYSIVLLLTLSFLANILPQLKTLLCSFWPERKILFLPCLLTLVAWFLILWILDCLVLREQSSGSSNAPHRVFYFIVSSKATAFLLMPHHIMPPPTNQPKNFTRKLVHTKHRDSLSFLLSFNSVSLTLWFWCKNGILSSKNILWCGAIVKLLCYCLVFS